MPLAKLWRYASRGVTRARAHDHDNRPDRPDTETYTEADPLLPRRPSTSQRRASCFPTFRKGSSIVVLLIAVIIVCSVGSILFGTPQQRIFEAILCYHYYEIHDPSQIKLPRDVVGPGALGGVDEMMCKVDSVQSELATLYGYQTLFDGIPSLIMAVPVGWMADRYGRRPLLRLALFSVVLRMVYLQVIVWYWQRLDLRLIWLSSLHGFLAGGSGTVLSNLVFLIITDVTDVTERASVFMRLSATNIIPGLVVTPLSALWMKFHPWWPYFSGTVLLIVALFMALLIPETRNFRTGTVGEPSPVELMQEELSEKNDDPDDPEPQATSAIRRGVQRARHALAFLLDDWSVLAITMVYAGHALMLNSEMIMVQYCSERYRMTYANSILLSTIGSIVDTLLLLLVIPRISLYLIDKRHFSGQRKDRLLSLVSFVLLAAGWLTIAMAPNIPVVAIGIAVLSAGRAAAYLLARSLLTTLVPARHMARTFSALSVCDCVGKMVGAAGMAELFKVGMRAGPQWSGAPFVLLAVIGLFSALAMGLIRPHRAEPESSS